MKRLTFWARWLRAVRDRLLPVATFFPPPPLPHEPPKPARADYTKPSADFQACIRSARSQRLSVWKNCSEELRALNENDVVTNVRECALDAHILHEMFERKCRREAVTIISEIGEPAANIVIDASLNYFAREYGLGR